MAADTKNEQEKADSAKITSAVAILPASYAVSTKWRAGLCTVSVLGGCTLWFVTLSCVGATMEALPWYITIGVIGVICAHKAARPVLSEADDIPGAIKSREPITLLESWAASYLIAAITLYVCACMQAILPKPSKVHLTQFVDIQLVSPTDAENRNSPLPGTVEKEQLHKRVSDQVTQQGALNSTKIPKVASSSQSQTQSSQQPTPQRDEQQDSKKQLQQKHTKAFSITAPKATAMLAPKHPVSDDLMFLHPTTPPPSAPVKPKQATQGKTNSNQPFFEEVQPPEMVELIENDGANQSSDIFEIGGSSQGGKGAENDLDIYIKSLHKRIKGLWSPPRGQSRKAAVLFRIRKEGRLAFVRLVQSSGDQETDNAAVKAIAGAVKNHSLPSSSKIPFLDVQYTFNYTADEIKEVTLPKGAN